MPSLSLRSWIGNAAAVLFGKHGDITQRAQQAGCSRQAAYDHADKVQQAVADAQLPGPSRAALIEENRRLQDQLAQAQRRLSQVTVLDKDLQRRLAVTPSAMGLSRNQIREVFAILRGHGTAPGRATLGRWVKQPARQAGQVLVVLDQHTRPAAVDLCPDEIFFHGKPVLVGVEPQSLALLLCRRAKDRTGDTWHEALGPFPALE
jgi:hypothetical protein